ncbi:MAG: HlyD family efflux transporter periplasmic adaptor subunit, partial [Paludibacteraceae bacterium]|nr:HlyD family efflux transporter periplasmic adaptor subunit [Paludibacteraceae bacterium]
VTVSAEQNGRLLSFALNEGEEVSAGAELGLIDTVALALQLEQARATHQVYASQRPDTEKQIAATRSQLAKARTEQRRCEELVKDDAVPTKMLDDATSQVELLERQLDAQLSSLSRSTNTLNNQMAATDVQIRLLQDQLNRCHIKAPITGTVLDKYAEEGEFMAVGKPLFKIADISRMYLRAYITSQRLEQVKTGQKVTVFADYGDGLRKPYEGVVTWIASHSEFTPKTILTDDERADQVYAVKISVVNDGLIKIGMYGEVKF